MQSLTCDGLKAKVAEQVFMLTYFGDPGELLFADAYLSAASSDTVEKFEFYHVLDSDCATHFAVQEPAVVAFRSFAGSGRAVYEGEATEEALRRWFKPRQYPRHFMFNDGHSKMLLEEKVPAVVLFYRKDDESESFVRAFEQASRSAPGDMLFAYADYTRAVHKELAEDVFETNHESFPTLRAIDPLSESKYVYEGKVRDMTSQDVVAFVTGILDGTLEEHLAKTEPVPLTNIGPLKVVVGRTYKAIVRDPTKHVFILLYSPWCRISQKRLRIWTQLAELYSGSHDLVIAQMDITKNEAPGLDIGSSSYQMRMFPKDDKKVGKIYTDEADLHDFEAWIRRVTGVSPPSGEAPKDDL